MTRGPCDTEQFPGPGFWLLALCWIAVALGSGEASAEDVVFEPVSNLPIVDNFIQVHNPSGEAGSYTIQFADNESDLVLDQIEGDLDAGASAFVYLDAVDVDDARLLTVTVSSTFPGFAQHFVWDPQQRVLSNWSSCAGATALGGMTIPGVRSGTLAPFHGGRITIEGGYGASEPMSIQVYAGDTGVNLGEWTSPVIPEGGMVTVGVEEILAEVSSTNLQTDTFNLVAQNGFTGRLQYTVGGRGDTTVDLTAKCRFGPWHRQRQAQRESVSALASMSSINPERDVEIRQRERPNYATYPGHPKLGDPELGTGAEIKWAFYDPEVTPFGPCGFWYSLDLGPVPCLTEDIPDRLKGYIHRAHDTWSRAADVTFVEVPPEDPSAYYRIGLGIRSLDSFKSYSGRTSYHFRPRDEKYLALNSAHYGDTAYFDQEVLDQVLHEIGHIIGLDDEFFVPGIMGGSLDRLSYLEHWGDLSDDDIAGARFLYGRTKQISKTYIDDFDGHNDTEALIAPGETISGNIDFPGDEDWFRVFLTLGHTYLFELTRGDDDSPLNGIEGQLYYHAVPTGRVVTDAFLANTGTSNASIAFTPHYAGWYWIAARGGNNAKGAYQLSVTDLSATKKEEEEEETEVAVSEGESDLPHDLDSEGFVPVDGSATGTLDSAADRDYFKIQLVSGAKYEFSVTGREAADTDPLVDPFLVLRDADNVFVDQDDDSGDGSNPSIIHIPSTSGDFWLDVRSFGTMPTGAYTVSVAQLAEPTPMADENADIASGTDSAASLATGQSFIGRIGTKSDTDWFKVSVQKYVTYAFEIDTVDVGAVGVSDPVLVLRNDTGQMIGIRDDNAGGLNPRFIIWPYESGDLWLEVRGFNGATGRYRVTARELVLPIKPPETDFLDVEMPPSTTTTTFVPLAGFVRGTLETAGDRDAYKIALTGGYTYRLELKGLDGEDELIDPYLVIRDEEGSFLSQRDGSDRQGASLDFRPAATGVYIAQVTSYGDEPIGEYALSLNLARATNDDVEGTPYTIAALESDNTSVTGNIDFIGDRDYFKVKLEEGGTYTISVEPNNPIAEDLKILLNMYPHPPGGGDLRSGQRFRVYEADRNLRAGRQLGGNTDYVLVVSGDFFNRPGIGAWAQTGPYTLTVIKQ